MILAATATFALVLTGSVMMTAQLIDILKSTDTSTRQQAEVALEAMGANAIESLAQAMHSDDLGQAWRAARLMAKIDDPRRVTYMTEALTSTNGLVGQVAVKVIVAILPPDAAGACLTGHLLDSHPIVQVHMIAALITMHYQAAVEPMMRLLTITESSEVRYTAIEGLGMLNAFQAVDLIRSFEHDGNHHVRERSEAALQRLGR